MPTYNQRLTQNNVKIDEITTIARNLPDTGGRRWFKFKYICTNN